MGKQEGLISLRKMITSMPESMRSFTYCDAARELNDFLFLLNHRSTPNCDMVEQLVLEIRQNSKDELHKFAYLLIRKLFEFDGIEKSLCMLRLIDKQINSVQISCMLKCCPCKRITNSPSATPRTSVNEKSYMQGTISSMNK